ncbi:hypothetical protein CASFOL_015126 [Castilleja foliolosa]|uniref:DUF4005 domain-containing protein n=1 Tax=Castilleja foliolosa TaxID=1961234 RepID=A0ABD3DDE2_9LAMI
MGKSPGKWIKTVLFGKKHSKSKLSKNVTPDKKAATEDNSPVISDPHQLVQNGADNIELEKGTSVNSSTVNRDLEPQSKSVLVPLSDDEMRKQCEIITKAQAVFRGYLARRAFRALKGIIRLQALIRGHLVRRQAVATLRCMQAIVKLQALARRQRVDIGTNSVFGSRKLSTNAYVRKLLLLLPALTPLSLQYDLDEPNSSSNWLERWSLSRFWDPPAHPRKASNFKPQSKQSGSQNLDNEPMKAKQTTRKPSNIGDNGALSSSFKTDKRNPKRAQIDFAQDQAQSELERVKHSLKKVSASLNLPSGKLETEYDKPNIIVSEDKTVIPAKNVPDPDVTVDNNEVGFPDAPTATDDNCLLVETHSLGNGGKSESARFSHDDELSSRDDEIRKTRKRRSLPEYSRSISLRLPSYMMATESAKAKLRAQGGSMAKLIREDGPEPGFVRRHSLPNRKIGVQNQVLANNVKVGSGKGNRSMTFSKDDKVLHPGWRR